MPGTPDYDARAPTLADSLAVLAADPAACAEFAVLGARARCLIQGYTAPGNAAALRGLLGGTGVGQVDIAAIDLMDLPAIYAALGIAMPAIDFYRADAAVGTHLFAAGSFDLVVQDFLLNCTPPDRAPAILGELARVLRPGGLAILSFTTVDDAPADTTGRLVRHADGALTCFTEPSGRPEYFVPLMLMTARLDAAELETCAAQVSLSRDYNGLPCTRHRRLMRRL